jgi:hypothetical protein
MAEDAAIFAGLEAAARDAGSLDASISCQLAFRVDGQPARLLTVTAGQAALTSGDDPPPGPGACVLEFDSPGVYADAMAGDRARVMFHLARGSMRLKGDPAPLRDARLAPLLARIRDGGPAAGPTEGQLQITVVGVSEREEVVYYIVELAPASAAPAAAGHVALQAPMSPVRSSSGLDASASADTAGSGRMIQVGAARTTLGPLAPAQNPRGTSLRRARASCGREAPRLRLSSCFTTL